MEKAEKKEFHLRDLPQDLIQRGREMAGLGHEVWLAGLGAVATVEEEGTNLFQSLVDRGQKVEEAGVKRVSALRVRIGDQQKAMVEKMEDSVYEPLLNALRRFGVPNRTEVRELTSKVDALARRVDMLVNRLPEGGAPPPEFNVYYVMARDEGWMIGKEGMEEPFSLHPTKDEALERARALAGKDIPARLHVYRKDGTMQDTLTYME